MTPAIPTMRVDWRAVAILIRRRGWRWNDLAAKLNVTPAALSQSKHAQANREETISAIANVLGVRRTEIVIATPLTCKSDGWIL